MGRAVPGGLGRAGTAGLQPPRGPLDVCLKNAMFDMATTDYGYATNDYKMRCDLNMVEYHVMNMVEYG